MQAERGVSEGPGLRLANCLPELVRHAPGPPPAARATDVTASAPEQGSGRCSPGSGRAVHPVIIDQSVQTITSSVAPWDGNGLSTFFDFLKGESLHLPPTPMLLGNGGVADSVTAVAATDSIKNPMERPPASEGNLQPQLVKSIADYKLSTSAAWWGTAASRGLAMNRSTAASRRRRGAASQKVCNDNSTSLLSCKGARQQATEEDRDTDLSAAACGGAVVGLRESSAVVLQPLDTLQDTPLDEGKDHPNGKGDYSPSFTGGTGYPDTAAAAAAIRVPMLESRGQPSCRQSSRVSSPLSSHPTSIITAKPSFKSCSAQPQSVRTVESFRSLTGSRINYPGSVPGSSVGYADDVTRVDERHRPIRRMSSSCDLSVVWIAPPLCEWLRPGEACSVKGNSMAREDTCGAGSCAWSTLPSPINNDAA
ncbi:hypothetical protein CGC20_3170 [Leishmania donovani]|uniref:Uncharacterized protein n=1 Tax=Leishmania donovani TaxID=5661 RepID=A0A504WZW1_LEIDO|nr:hypothetical protein CGC20_3170 [Leishmania donovani]